MIVLLIVLLATVVLFSVQNASPVAITFLAWRFDASLALVVFLSFLLGMIIGAGILAWTRFRRSGRVMSAREEERSSPGAPR